MLRSLRHMAAPAFLVVLTAAGCQTPDGDASGPATGGAEPASDADSPVPETSRYLGDARRADGLTRLPATLDLIRVATLKDDSVHYRAILKLSPGGFGSHEYLTLYFADVTFDAGTRRLTFGAGPDGARLDGVALDDRTLNATLTAKKHRGLRLALVRATAEGTAAASAFAGLPIEPQVTGRYAGACPGGVAGLDIEASRWSQAKGADSAAATTPPVGYHLAASTAETSDFGCGQGHGCIKESFSAGSLDVLTGELSLRVASTASDGPKCKQTGDALVCGGCKLTKDPKTPHAVVDAPRESKPHARAKHLPPAPAAEDQRQSAAHGDGQYYGYLHHEALDAYQLVALNLKDRAGVATLYFGEGDSSEFVAYRVQSTPAAPLVLDGDGEMFLVLDAWQGPALTGTWYSKTFGRVGTVELQPDLVPDLGSDVERVDRVSGIYRGDGWQFELAASAGVSEAPGDYYPLKVFGWAQERLDHARRRTINDGSYDFYTGTFAFRLDDGRIALGRVTPTGMHLHWPPKPRRGTLLPDDKVELFQRVSGDMQALVPVPTTW